MGTARVARFDLVNERNIRKPAALRLPNDLWVAAFLFAQQVYVQHGACGFSSPRLFVLEGTNKKRGNKEGTESLLVNFRADHSTGSSAARSSGALLGARLHNFKALLFAFLARGPPPCPTFAALRLCVPVQPARLPLAGGVTGARHSQPLVAPLVAPQDANHSKQACFWQYQRLLKEPLQFRAPRIRAAARSQSQKDARGSAPRSRKESGGARALFARTWRQTRSDAQRHSRCDA